MGWEGGGRILESLRKTCLPEHRESGGGEETLGLHPARGERCPATALPLATRDGRAAFWLGAPFCCPPLPPSSSAMGSCGGGRQPGVLCWHGRRPRVLHQPPATSEGTPGWHLGAPWLCQPCGQACPHCPSSLLRLRCHRASRLCGCLMPGKVAQEGSAATLLYK